MTRLAVIKAYAEIGSLGVTTPSAQRQSGTSITCRSYVAARFNTGMGRASPVLRRPTLLLLLLAQSFMLVMATALAADEAVDCARFQQGPLREREIHKSVGLRVPGDVVYAPFRIHYRYDYLFQPAFDGSGNGEPKSDELFLIDMNSGAPVKQGGGDVDPAAREASVRILAYGNTWSPVWTWLLAWEVMRDEVFAKQLPLRPDRPLVNPVHFRYLDRKIGEFTELERSQFTIDTPGDLFVLLDAEGEVSEILLCDSLGQVPFPHCSLSARTQNFKFEASFDRSQLGKLNAIRRSVREFVICLTQGVE